MEIIIDDKPFKILFKFNIGECNYVAYLNENDEISASKLIIDNDKAHLEVITDDNEWEQVEKEIDKRLN